MKMIKKAFIVLPAFNEEKIISSVLINLKKVLKGLGSLQWRIVVIDDGSWDKTAQKAKKEKVVVLRHIINRGLGGALATGFKYVRSQGGDLLVTMDSDGQHDPRDLIKVIKPILSNQTDLVIGKREILKMPWDRKIITVLSTFLTFIFFRIWCKDSQSGFRAFGKKAIHAIQIKTQRMEVSSEFFTEIKKHKLKFTEIPIRVIYSPYSRAKGQSNLNSIKVLLKLFLRLAR